MNDNYETPYDDMFDYDHDGTLSFDETCMRNDYILELTEPANKGYDYSHSSSDISTNGGYYPKKNTPVEKPKRDASSAGGWILAIGIGAMAVFLGPIALYFALVILFFTVILG